MVQGFMGISKMHWATLTGTSAQVGVSGVVGLLIIWMDVSRLPWHRTLVSRAQGIHRCGIAGQSCR